MSLSGKRVFLVEDEGHVAFLMETMLETFGCVVTDSAWRLSQAVAIAEATTADIAVLDVNLAGEQVFPAAEVLRRRNLPFIFTTGFGRASLAREFPDVPVVGKPFRSEDLEAAMKAALIAPVLG